jgi:hypothetical protein
VRFFLIYFLISPMLSSLIIIVSGCRENDSTDKKHPPLTTEASPKNVPERRERTIEFLGVQGLAPAYIDSGEKKGQGWQEEFTFLVRENLLKNGYRVDLSYMTPARIQYELKTGLRPVCYFPHYWSAPEKTMTRKPKILRSLPLLANTEHRFEIIIKKEKLGRFKKHMDEQGNLSLRRLLADSSLQTYLINGEDYGALNAIVMESNNIKSEYKQVITQMVASDNSQIVSMLNNNRFDYYFSFNITRTEFIEAEISVSDFIWLPVEVKKEKEKEKEKERSPTPTIMQSIACSVHAVTKVALGHINQAIIDDYQSSDLTLEKLFTKKSLIIAAHNNQVPQKESYNPRRAEELTQEALETWYPAQQKYFPGLVLLPPDPKYKLVAIEKRDMPAPQWLTLIRGHKQYIINEASLNHKVLRKQYYEEIFDIVPDLLSQKKHYSTVLSPSSEVKELHFFADEVESSAQLTLLLNHFKLNKKLTKLIVYRSLSHTTGHLLKQLPSQIKELKLVEARMYGLDKMAFAKLNQLKGLICLDCYYEIGGKKQLLSALNIKGLEHFGITGSMGDMSQEKLQV